MIGFERGQYISSSGKIFCSHQGKRQSFVFFKVLTQMCWVKKFSRHNKRLGNKVSIRAVTDDFLLNHLWQMKVRPIWVNLIRQLRTMNALCRHNNHCIVYHEYFIVFRAGLIN